MAVLPSLYDLPARLFKLTQQIDEVAKKLDVYGIALNEVSYLTGIKKIEPLQVLLWDLQKHSITLSKLQKEICGLTALDLPPASIERIEPLRGQIEKLQQIYQVLAAQTKKLKEEDFK